MASLAKSSGITLRAHTDHVIEEAQNILNAFPFLEKKYQEHTSLDLRMLLLQSAEYHDKGKIHPQWQAACKEDYERYVTWCKQNKLAINIETYQAFEQYAAKHKIKSRLLYTHLRHEFASLEWLDERCIELTWIERAAIAAHHGKLGYRHKKRWEEDAKDKVGTKGPFAKYWDEFCNHTKKVTTEKTFVESLDKRYALSGVRSLLQLADTRASRKESQGWLVPFTSFQYEFPHKDKNGYPSYRGVQAIIQTYWDEPALILRAPTGSGKTDAALLWAKHQIITRKRADRLVIAMPTRFTSNALALTINETLSETGLYHSSAWYTKFQKDGRAEKMGISNAKEVHKLARLLNTPITVSTIDHLFIALTGTREDHHAIFFNLMNACVVIDEADFYDTFVQANLVILLTVLKHFKVPILIMSATVPESAKELYQIPVVAEDTSQIHKARSEVFVHEAVHTLEQIELLLMQALEQPSIIYANTIERSLAYLTWFKKRGIENVKLYHSRFTEPDKARIEQELIEMLGKKAWLEGRASGIAIMTQIGEMSINISAPFMISDLCPYDRLAQRAGRLNRFTESIGALHIVVPYKNNALYPAPYGSYNLNTQSWEIGVALQKTKDTLENRVYSPADFIDAVNMLYPKPEPLTGKAETNVDHLRQHIKHDWLIVPCAKLDEDAEETEWWRSRDIELQEDVFVKIDDAEDIFDEDESAYRVPSWSAFTSLQLEHAIKVPRYQVEKGGKSGEVFKRIIYIEDEKRTIFYAPYYDEEIGLVLGTSLGHIK